jgi:excinuclease ABC subunit C
MLRRRFRRQASHERESEVYYDEKEGESIVQLEQEVALQHDWALPDLIIIDGGKGQLSAAMEVLQELHIDIPTVGLAKENEEIFVPGSPDPIILPRSSQGLYMVQCIRDEAHRFGITYHRKLRSERTFKSVLDEIPGIGPKRKQALMKHYGTVRAISAASIDELAALNGMTRDAAEKVKEYIGRVE